MLRGYRLMSVLRNALYVTLFGSAPERPVVGLCTMTRVQSAYACLHIASTERRLRNVRGKTRQLSASQLLGTHSCQYSAANNIILVSLATIPVS